MKRLALVAAVVILAACSSKETPVADTAAANMAPAPAMAADTMAPAMTDSAKAAAAMDTAMKKADTAVKKP